MKTDLKATPTLNITMHEIKPKNAGKNIKSSYLVSPCLSPANSKSNKMIQIESAILLGIPKLFTNLLKILIFYQLLNR